MQRVPFAPLSWQEDVPVHEAYQDHYFSRDGGLEETRYVFLASNDLPQAWQGRGQFVIGETGFGTGLNFLATVDAWLKTSLPGQVLHYFSLDRYAMRAEDMRRSLASWPELSGLAEVLLDAYPEPVKGFHRRHLFDDRVQLTLAFGEVEEVLQQVQGSMDVWYLDGFAPGKNPDMWREAVFTHLARLCRPGARLATFTVAGKVRRGLQAAGFEVHKIPGFGRKREMLQAHLVRPLESRSQTPWFDPPLLTPSPQTALVIGGGIAGVAAAWQLSQRGLAVTLLEAADRLAAGASGNPAGIVYPRLTLDWNREGRFGLMAFLYTSRLLDQLQDDHGALPWHRTGVGHLLSEEKVSRLLAAELPEQVLRLVDDAEQPGIVYERAGWVEAGNLCRFLAAQAADGLQVSTGAAVTGVSRLDNVWQAETADGRTYQAEVVVLANAGHARQLGFAADLPLQISRGQISLFESDGFVQEAAMPRCGEGYVIPMADGRFCAGAGYDRDDLGLQLREQDHKFNRHIMHTLFPAAGCGDFHLAGGRAGLRVSSEDHLPLVGAVPAWPVYRRQYADLRHGRPASHYPPAACYPGLFLSLAHGSRGFTTALPAGALLADLVCGTPALLPRDIMDALHPGRFAVRGLKRGIC